MATASVQLQEGTAEKREKALDTYLAAVFPEGRFGVRFWHDWLADPETRGTWCLARPGQLDELCLPACHEPPLPFAGGDVSRRWIG